MLQTIKMNNGRNAVAIVIPDFENLSEIASLKSAVFLAAKTLAQESELCCSEDMYELLNLLECMEIAPETL